MEVGKTFAIGGAIMASLGLILINLVGAIVSFFGIFAGFGIAAFGLSKIK